MSSKIRVLDEHTINKIAAGEVIENPSSVVKELVENALDAGATSICVEIQEGGRQLIRVSDNGCGMSKDDALLCLERHATSKISEVEDIQKLMTMGFRGEAIPSIAAISKFSILTSPHADGSGTIVTVEGGRVLACQTAPRAKGTTIEAKSLFFNVPVRRKFQKSPAYDVQAVLKMMSLLALGYPTIQFELISDQKSLIKTPLDNELPFNALLLKRIESILGSEFVKDLIPVQFQEGPYSLQGFIGNTYCHKPNRANQYLFINQRGVTSAAISAAVKEGYGTTLPTQRYPLFVLHLNLPGHLVDVNVHPQKKEVRLRQEFALKDSLMKAIQNALKKGPVSFEEKVVEEEAPPPFYSTSFAPTFRPFQSFEEKWEYKPTFHETTLPKEIEEEKSELPLFVRKAETPRVYLTIKGYFLVDGQNEKLAPLTKEGEGGLCLVDQRRAHTRIFFEKLRSSQNKEGVQSLLVPVTVSFTAIEAKILLDHLEALNQMGFAIREFGPQTFALDAIPSYLKKEEAGDCIREIVGELAEMGDSRRLQGAREEQLASLACRASMPAQKRLSIEEAQQLMQQLFACEQPFHCPQGKPIFTYLSPDTIKKLF